MLKLLGALVGLVALASPAAAQSSGNTKQVVVGVFGGVLGKQLRENIERYTKPLGLEAVFVEGTASELSAKVLAQKANPQIDMYMGNVLTFTAAKQQGVAAKLDPKLVPNLADTREGFVDAEGYGQAFMINTLGYVYRKDLFDEKKIGKPSSWTSGLLPELKGRAVAYPPAQQYYGFATLIGLVVAGGSNEADAAAIQSAIEKIKANEPVVLPAPGQAEELIQRGEIWAYLASAARGQLMASKDPRIGFALAEDALIPMNSYIIPVAGSPNPDAAQGILNFLLSPEMQQEIAERELIIPVNKMAAVSDDLKAKMGFDPSKPIPAFYDLDIPTIGKELPGWQDTFTRVMAQ